MLAAADGDGGVSEAGVLGVLSLIFWSLIIIVTLKYVLILTRADNRGEGGTLALMALAQECFRRAAPVIVVARRGRRRRCSTATRSSRRRCRCSPRSKGSAVVEPVLKPSVLPLTVVILVVLFLVQSRGTASVAALFGPITQRLVPGAGRRRHHSDMSAIRSCFSPSIRSTRSRFLFGHGIVSLVTLGAVFLAVTGAEALYADLGHFGRRPIQIGLARLRAAGAGAQLFRPGRAGAQACPRRSTTRSS